MKTQKKFVPLKEIINLRSALKDFDNKDIELDLYMEIGIVSANLEHVLLEYNKAETKAKKDAAIELKVDTKSKEVNVFALNEYNTLLSEKLETILNKKYEILCPSFTYKELKDLVNSTKNKTNPFIISHRFLSNINYFIEN